MVHSNLTVVRDSFLAGSSSRRTAQVWSPALWPPT